MRTKYTGIMICALLCTLVFAIPAAAGNGKIAFSRQDQALDWQIFVMNDDGSNPTQLTFYDFNAFHPSWSPNGTFIVFDADVFEGHGLWMMKSDGSDLHNINFNPGQNDRDPVWSPDGLKIAYTHEFPSRNKSIYMMDAGGGNHIRLTDNDDPTWVWAQWPAWSPDSRMIAYSSRGAIEDYEIFVINAVDPTREYQWRVRLTDSTHELNMRAAWSPDGKQIAFESWYPGFYRDIAVVNTAGVSPSVPIPLTDNKNDHLEYGYPAWSPDGKKIVYSDDNGWLYVMNKDGSNPAPLGNQQVGLCPAWWGPPEPDVIPFPGESGSPTDPDDDDLYEDVNGNNLMDYDDAVVLFWNLAWVDECGLGSSFDFNGNGIMDYDDAVTLFWEI